MRVVLCFVISEPRDQTHYQSEGRGVEKKGHPRSLLSKILADRLTFISQHHDADDLHYDRKRRTHFQDPIKEQVAKKSLVLVIGSNGLGHFFLNSLTNLWSGS